MSYLAPSNNFMHLHYTLKIDCIIGRLPNKRVEKSRKAFSFQWPKKWSTKKNKAIFWKDIRVLSPLPFFSHFLQKRALSHLHTHYHISKLILERFSPLQLCVAGPQKMHPCVLKIVIWPKLLQDLFLKSGWHFWHFIL